MKLIRVKLENFQVHGNLDVPFSDGVTCLVGETDEGKSTVIRALRWVMLNSLKGEPTKFGAKSTCVTLWVNDGTRERVVVRRRTASKNQYFLDGEEFVSFGNSVPEPIAALFNVTPVNFQMQAEPTFLLNETSGEVARQLNKFVALDAIDATQKEADARLRKASARVEVLGEEEEKLEGRLSEFDANLDERDKLLTKIEAKSVNLETGVQSLNRLAELLNQLDDIDLERLHKRARASERVVEIAGGRLMPLVDKATALRKMIGEIKDAELKISTTNAPNFSRVEDHYNATLKLRQRLQRLERVLNRIDETENQLEEANRTKTKVEGRFLTRTEGQICPLCETKIKR